MKFEDSKKFPNLDGGNEDAEALKNLFSNLQFTVEVCSNLNAHFLREKVKEYSHMDHKGRAFILIILSHGGEGDVVYGTDTGEVKVHELQEMFHTTSCHRSLDGIPKVFLIDACRGGNHEKVHMHGHRQVRGPSIGCRSAIGITDSADFMTVYASTRGNVAYMFNDGDKKGSCFTQMLVEVMREADEDKEINEIITEVRSRILSKYIQLAIHENAEKEAEEADEAEAEKKEENIKEAEGQTVQASSTLLRKYFITRFVSFDSI